MDFSNCRALLFDVDGTLYDQRPVRTAMLFRLLRNCVRPGGWTELRAVQAYRRAQESLRERLPEGCCDLEGEQIRTACSLARQTEQQMTATVERWMEKAPLDLLAGAMRPGLRQLLERAKAAGLRMGVCSDYPCVSKLQAMGIDKYFDVVVHAQHASVLRFKPDPAGLLYTLQELGVSADESVYIGDRPEVDVRAAEAAGMRAVLVGSRRAAIPGCTAVQDFQELSLLMFPVTPDRRQTTRV